MLAFEISVNGTRQCVAASKRVLSAAITATGDHSDLIMNVGGISDATDDTHLRWDTPQIGIGDEVTIRIVDTDSPDLVYKPAMALRDHDDDSDGL